MAHELRNQSVTRHMLHMLQWTTIIRLSRYICYNENKHNNTTRQLLRIGSHFALIIDINN